AEHDAARHHARIVAAQESGHGAQRGRLAGAVRAEQRDDGTLRDAQRHALHGRGDAVVDDLDVLELEDVTHHTRSGRWRKGHKANQWRTRRHIPTNPSGSNSRKSAMRSPNAPNFAGKT